MKLDREIIKLAKSRTLETIAEKLQRRPRTVHKRAVRLGLSIRRRPKRK